MLYLLNVDLRSQEKKKYLFFKQVKERLLINLYLDAIYLNMVSIKNISIFVSLWTLLALFFNLDFPKIEKNIRFHINLNSSLGNQLKFSVRQSFRNHNLGMKYSIDSFKVFTYFTKYVSQYIQGNLLMLYLLKVDLRYQRKKVLLSVF